MYTASIESWIDWGLKLFPWIFFKYFLNCNAVAIVPSPTGSENICLTGLKPQAMVIDHQEFHATNCMGGFFLLFSSLSPYVSICLFYQCYGAAPLKTAPDLTMFLAVASAHAPAPAPAPATVLLQISKTSKFNKFHDS